MGSKIRLTDMTKIIKNPLDNTDLTVRRVEYLASDGTWKQGGWAESEQNFENDTLIEGNAIIFGEARLSDCASLSNNAIVGGNAQISDFANITGGAKVFGGNITGGTWVHGEAEITGGQIQINGEIAGKAKVSGGNIRGNTKIYDNAQISDNVTIKDCSIYEDAVIARSAIIRDSIIRDKAVVTGEAIVENSSIMGTSLIMGKAEVHDSLIQGDSVLSKGLISKAELNDSLDTLIEVILSKDYGLEGLKRTWETLKTLDPEIEGKVHEAIYDAGYIDPDYNTEGGIADIQDWVISQSLIAAYDNLVPDNKIALITMLSHLENMTSQDIFRMVSGKSDSWSINDTDHSLIEKFIKAIPQEAPTLDEVLNDVR